jgi:tripartite-type tricarboxylate transporter receptor subunit TctC
MTTRRSFLLSGAAIAVLPRLASAQQWPSKPIRAIVPFSAGSTSDIIGRIVLESLSEALGQPGVADKLKPQGLEPMPITPAQFDALIAKEIETNKAIVKAAGLKFN